MKPYEKPYNLMQYIRIDKYISYEELAKKTNKGTNTLKKQLYKARKSLRGTGYHFQSSNKGVKLIGYEVEYLPADLIFFNSLEFDFIEIFIDFIISGLCDFKVFTKEFNKRYYSKRQMLYFFPNKLNQNFEEFKEKNNFEYFTMFVEYCVIWFNCLNIKKLFDDYVDINEFNESLLSYDEYERISAYDYLLIYSIVVFEKINTVPISTEYRRIIHYFKHDKYLEGLKYFKMLIKFTQHYRINDSLIEYFNEINNIRNKYIDLNYSYKNIECIAYEIEHLQSEITKVISNKTFDLTLIYETHEESLAVIKGTLKKNYPNINIICVPSWIYLYANINPVGLVLSNAAISLGIDVIQPRDIEGNYILKFER